MCGSKSNSILVGAKTQYGLSSGQVGTDSQGSSRWNQGEDRTGSQGARAVRGRAGRATRRDARGGIATLASDARRWTRHRRETRLLRPLPLEPADAQ